MIIITRKTGKMANRMLLFANFIAFSKEFNIPLASPALDEYSIYFEGTYNDFFCRFPKQESLLDGENLLMRRNFHRMVFHPMRLFLPEDTDFRFFNLEILKLPAAKQLVNLDQSFAERVRGSIVFTHGYWFRNPSLFSKHADVIRAYFKPRYNHRKKISQVTSAARKGCDLLVGLHIRQGDYKLLGKGRYLYSTEAYADLAKQVVNLFPGRRVRFLLCSDSKQDLNSFSGLDIALPSNHLIEDMYSLAECDYIMGPPSTYNMWAAFYGKKPLCRIENLSQPVKLDLFKTYDVPLDVLPSKTVKEAYESYYGEDVYATLPAISR